MHSTHYTLHYTLHSIRKLHLKQTRKPPCHLHTLRHFVSTLQGSCVMSLDVSYTQRTTILPPTHRHSPVSIPKDASSVSLHTLPKVVQKTRPHYPERQPRQEKIRQTNLFTQFTKEKKMVTEE
ncbi:hypothetical protein E2C01_066751 [Portunus trituberculatus]|uniref:Uncharacterized protein n=1 Tax=Portunus trituberculatus TaxID=210409 RepID=A0A5B7HRI2_PORTR|nr:hypothetical protein [Portunus trituberculatus]